MELYTAGYEGTSVGAFIEALTHAGVKVLADVRAVPLSRKKGFSKSTLAAGLARSGIGYRHLRALGTPKSGREAHRAGRIDLFRSIYLRQLETLGARKALSDLKTIAKDAPVCLMCFERDPADCHRSLIVAAMRAGRTVHHLFPAQTAALKKRAGHRPPRTRGATGRRAARKSLQTGSG